MAAPSITTTSLLELNSRAVAFLEKGMYREADSLLVRALTQFTEALQPTEVVRRTPTVTTTAAVVTCKEQRHPSSASLLRVIPICILDQILMVEQAFSPNNCFAFYNKSFVAVEARASEYSYSVSTQKQLAAVLWYNWGVTCHCAAISNGSCELLRRALDLYNKSFITLIQELGTIRSSSSSSSVCSKTEQESTMSLLLLALCNNMGHCACYFADKVTARGFHEYIQKILSNSRCDRVIAEAFDFFYTTALLDSKMIMSLSPAA